MDRAASLHRKTAASAHACGEIGPATTGCLLRRYAAIAGSVTARAAIGVSVRPGARTLPRMRCAAYRAAAWRLSAMMPPLAAVYAQVSKCRGDGENASTLDVLTITPPVRCERNCRTAARLVKKTLRRFRSSVSVQ